MFTRFGGIALICCAMVCVGCGTTVVPEGEPAAVPADGNDGASDRLEVTDGLRAACYPYNLSDSDIQTLISTCEADRLGGNSYTQQIQMVLNVCYLWIDVDAAMGNACQNCNVAVVDQVYGF